MEKPYIADLSDSPRPSATPRKGKIGIVMNVYNGERHLEEVLESVRDFDDLVVVDMFSTDRTVEIARSYGARIFSFHNVGYCEPARNAAIWASDCEWVLVLDADEVVPPALLPFLRRLVASENPPHALRLPIRQYFMEREMRCLYPNHICRFLHRDSVYWPETVHAQPKVEGKVQTIPGSHRELALIHREENTLESRLEKIERYSDMEVLRRGHRHYSAFQRIAKPAARFIRSYIFKGGILDGAPGLKWAQLEALYKKKTIEKQDPRHH